MRLESVQSLLDFDGALPEALEKQARSDVLDAAARVVAFHRSRQLLELVRAEIKPARATAAAAREEADAAKRNWEVLLGQLRDAPEGERDELRRQYNEAETRARELDASAKIADQKARQLPWLRDSLRTIQRPDLDALEILKEVLV